MAVYYKLINQVQTCDSVLMRLFPRNNSPTKIFSTNDKEELDTVLSCPASATVSAELLRIIQRICVNRNQNTYHHLEGNLNILLQLYPFVDGQNRVILCRGLAIGLQHLAQQLCLKRINKSLQLYLIEGFLSHPLLQTAATITSSSNINKFKYSELPYVELLTARSIITVVTRFQRLLFHLGVCNWVTFQQIRQEITSVEQLMVVDPTLSTTTATILFSLMGQPQNE